MQAPPAAPAAPIAEEGDDVLGDMFAKPSVVKVGNKAGRMSMNVAMTAGLDALRAEVEQEDGTFTAGAVCGDGCEFRIEAIEDDLAVAQFGHFHHLRVGGIEYGRAAGQHVPRHRSLRRRR